VARIVQSLDHLPQQSVDLVLTTTKVTSIDEVVVLLSPSAIRRVEFEVPQKVSCLLEVGSNGVNLVNQILHANDSILA